MSQSVVAKTERMSLFFIKDLPTGLSQDRIVFLKNPAMVFEDAILSLNM